MKAVNTTRGLYITYLNEYMKKHLKLDYGTEEKKLIPLLNGIVHEEVPHYSEKKIQKTLEDHKIPTDKPLIISFGRGTKYKGFDIFLKSIKQLQRLPVHFVLQCSFFDPKDKVLRQLRILSKNISNLTFIPIFSYKLPRMLSQWKNSEICAVLSENEPGAFIPAEIRVYGQAIVLVSDRDGLPCQVDDGVDGFITDISDISLIARNLEHIFMLDLSEKKQIRDRGMKLIKLKYDIVKNFCLTLKKLIGKYEK